MSETLCVLSSRLMYSQVAMKTTVGNTTRDFLALLVDAGAVTFFGAAGFFFTFIFNQSKTAFRSRNKLLKVSLLYKRTNVNPAHANRFSKFYTAEGLKRSRAAAMLGVLSVVTGNRSGKGTIDWSAGNRGESGRRILLLSPILSSPAVCRRLAASPVAVVRTRPNFCTTLYHNKAGIPRLHWTKLDRKRFDATTCNSPKTAIYSGNLEV